MIDKNFWQKVSENWIKNDDGVSVPESTGPIGPIVPLVDAPVSDDEIDDILSDLGLDDE